GRPHRPALRGLGHARRVDPHACRSLPARDDRLFRSRPGDDAGRRARPQSLSRRAARLVSPRFEAPRGTHDVLPAEQPLWQRVIAELESLCALYGYRRLQTTVFEDTELFARQSGAVSNDPAVDAELIQLYNELLRRLGVTHYRLELNSIGDRNCRPAYLERLNAWLDEHEDVLDDEARQKRATTPLRVFDVKSERVQT